MFYKVAANTELVNTEHIAFKGGKGVGSRKLVVTTFSSNDQYITWFYVFLYKDTLFNIQLIH